MGKKKSPLGTKFRKKILLFVVFITGACLLVLEVVATRILAPYFGNTIFSVTSVIGVVLTALSFGYYYGGIYADKYPERVKFYRLVLLSGISVLFLQLLNSLLIPVIAYEFSLKSGPLIVSVILFLFPSFVLGMLSPFVIKLQQQADTKSGIGKLSGEVFFASTLGSILGTFLAGYYLIPIFGIRSIVVGVGFILSLIGIIGSFQPKSLKTFMGVVLAFFLFLTAIFIKQTSLKGEVLSEDGIYEKLSVVDTTYQGKAARVLLQDASFGSGIELGESSDNLLFEYTHYYKLYKLLPKEPRNALFIGGGAYTMPSQMAVNINDIKIDVTEIEPRLYEISKEYFELEENGKINNQITDGRRYLHDAKAKYDFIFSDVYSSLYSIPSHFTTVEFFQLAKDRLNEDGIFIANVIGDLSRVRESLLLSEVKTFQSVFSENYVFAVNSPQARESQNFILVGLKKKTDLLAGAEKIDDEFFKFLPLKTVDMNRFNLEIYPLLTDNYSPVDTLTASMLERVNTNQKSFRGGEAMALIEHIVNFGPRHYDSEGILKNRNLITSEMKELTGDSFAQSWEQDINNKKISLSNLIFRLNKERNKRIILGTHYDSKKFANMDWKNPDGNVPGANDSASSTAVLLEIANVIANSPIKPSLGIDFIFFDGEEGIEGEEWKPLGSEYFASKIKEIYPNELPEGGIILDMICDKDLDIYMEADSSESSPDVTEKIFAIGNSLYPDDFHLQNKHRIRDDHTALIKAGIPSTLLIDFDYPYFHTTEDTPDKCSPSSLEKVGNVLLKYIYSLD